MRITGLFFFLLGALIPLTFGQVRTPFIQQFTIDDGLPTNTINYLMQDSKGYIWAMGDGKAIKFNGKEFEYIYIGSFVDRLWEDTENNLWLGGNSLFTRLNENGLDTGFPHAQTHEMLKKDRTWLHDFEIDGEGNIWFTVNNKNTKTKKGVRADEPYYITAYKISGDSIEEIDLSKDPEAFRVSTNGFVKPLDNGKYLITGRNHKTDTYFENILKKDIPFSDTIFETPLMGLVPLSDGSFLAYSSIEIMHFNRKRIFHYEQSPLSVSITTVFKDSKNKIWIGSSNGMWQIDNEDINTLHKVENLPNHFVTSIMEDHEGQIWYSTYRSGIVKLRGSNLQRLHWPNNEKRNIIYTSTRSKDELWFVSIDGSLHRIDAEEKIFTKELKGANGPYSIMMSGDTLMTGIRQLIYKDKVSQLRSIEGRENYLNEYFRIIYPVGNGKVWTSSRYGVVLLDLQKKKVLKDLKDYGFENVAYGMSTDSKNNLWLSYGPSLYRFESDSLIDVRKEFPVLDSFPELRVIRDVNFGPEDHMFLTHAEGIIVFFKDGFQDLRGRKDLTGSKKFIFNYIKEDSSIWITGFGGIDKFKFNKETAKYERSFSMGKEDGLPIVIDNPIFLFQNKMYLGTNKGIYIIDSFEDNLASLPLIPIHITYFQSKDSVFDLNKDLNLSHKQNNISIGIEGISYQMGEKINYKYRLKGSETEWNSTNSPEIRYSKLKPGSYTFEVYAEREDLELRPEDANIHQLDFKIIPHFTQTWFFIIFMFTICAMLLAYAVYRFLRWKDRIDRRQRIITELKYQALQSQMSPHFIFNSMNSISYLVKNNKSEEADRYLNQFAGLLRGVLENAQFSFVSLMEEMELVQNYLELEQLQFGKQFQYFIDMDPELMAYGLQIPPMLIQPIIENSIRHGISPRGYGNVRVDFKDQQRYLQISIEDDGVGRKFAEEMKKQSLRRSSKTQVGLKNIYERISVLNHLYELDMNMEVIDLEEGDKASGTRVVFRFPKVKHLPKIEKSPFHSYQDLAENQDKED